MRFKDRVVVVTGGGAGIGRATAERFAEEGARVAICDLNEAAGREALAALGPNARYDNVNVADRAAVGAWIDTLVADLGRIDVLVNNAGVLRDGQLVKMADGQLVKQLGEPEFDLVISVNLKGVFNCTQAAAPHMIRQGGGVILNASSIVGEDGNFGQTSYVAAKAGVIGMTRVWARELGRHGVRVNAVAPGFTATEMVRAMPAKVLDGMRARTPLGRLGEPRDVANAYVFLASEEAAFITGVTLRVDGGIVVGT